MEDRIERLENLVSLQDRMIEELNEALVDQQKQIGDMKRLVERMAGKLRHMESQMDNSGPIDTPPPHYNG